MNGLRASREVSGAVVSAGSGCGCDATFLVEIKNQLRFFFFFDVLFPCSTSGPALEKMNSVCPYRTARG